MNVLDARCSYYWAFLSVSDTLLKYFPSLLGSKVKAIKELCITPTPTAPFGLSTSWHVVGQVEIIKIVDSF